jgi:hypothetical protein
VDDPLRVRRVQTIGDLDRQLRQLVLAERTLDQQMLQRLPLEQLHREKVPRFMLPEVVNRADVRVIQG